MPGGMEDYSIIADKAIMMLSPYMDEKLLASYVKTLAAAKDLCGSDAEVRTLDNIRERFKVAK